MAVPVAVRGERGGEGGEGGTDKPPCRFCWGTRQTEGHGPQVSPRAERTG